MKITPSKPDRQLHLDDTARQPCRLRRSFEPSPVLEFLVRNRLMLAQTWVTHPHPDHEGGAAALWRGYMESPVYGESDIEAATHTVTAGTRFTFGNGQVTVWATPGHTDRHTSYLLETSDGIHVFCGDTLFPPAADACLPARSNSFTTTSNGSTNYPKAPCSIRHTNTPPPTCVSPPISSRTTPTFRRH